MRKQKPVQNTEKEQLRRMRRLDMIRAGILLVLVSVMFTLVFGITVYHGSSTENGLKEGDLLLYYRLYSGYHAGDTVVYREDGQIRAGRIAAGQGGEYSVFTVEEAEEEGLDGFVIQKAQIKGKVITLLRRRNI